MINKSKLTTINQFRLDSEIYKMNISILYSIYNSDDSWKFSNEPFLLKPAILALTLSILSWNHQIILEKWQIILLS